MLCPASAFASEYQHREGGMSVETQPRRERIVDINLTEADLRAWATQLERYFSNLQEVGEEFALESMLADFEERKY
jgi:hypothetical protein